MSDGYILIDCFFLFISSKSSIVARGRVTASNLLRRGTPVAQSGLPAQIIQRGRGLALFEDADKFAAIVHFHERVVEFGQTQMVRHFCAHILSLQIPIHARVLHILSIPVRLNGALRTGRLLVQRLFVHVECPGALSHEARIGHVPPQPRRKQRLTQIGSILAHKMVDLQTNKLG